MTDHEQQAIDDITRWRTEVDRLGKLLKEAKKSLHAAERNLIKALRRKPAD